MHGGQLPDLESVVAFYAAPGFYEGPGHREELLQYRGWGDDEQRELVAFLQALSRHSGPAPELLQPPSGPLP